MSGTYQQQFKRKNVERMRELTASLPSSCADFFRYKEPTTSALTRLNYAYDLRLFFTYLTQHEKAFEGREVTSIQDNDIQQVNSLMLEKYIEHLSYYTNDDGIDRENANEGKARKVASLKSYFRYMYKSERIPANVGELLDMPKISEKPIVRLEVDEVRRMMDAVDSGEVLTDKQKTYHKATRTRDVAIFTVLLGTGIRISELVGMNISDLDFNTGSFVITRKGGDRVVLYFGQEVEDALLAYLDDRNEIPAAQGHEDALFLSMQKKRISQRAIQNLVKKYAKVVTPLKKITPHKFRSTFGSMLNYETGDIYLVADVLGNKDVNTTRKHYAALSDESRRMAAGKVKLRDDSE